MAYVSQQPGAMPQMNAGGGNRNALDKPYDVMGQRPWSHGFFDCFADCGTCCVAWWCPCIVYGQNKTRLEYLDKTGQAHPDGGESFGNDCLIHGLLTCCGGWGWVLQISNRDNTRDRYRIQGSPFKDCFASWCCHPCSLTQESRELELEERSLRSQRHINIDAMRQDIPPPPFTPTMPTMPTPAHHEKAGENNGISHKV